ncbi:MAG: adenine deaminase [Spirochaetia bacterium]|nr:adenine deaminase [Spirochaetia bacterium]
MKTLLRNGIIVNVFTEQLEKADILIDGDKIIGVGDYSDENADIVENLDGLFVCPGFIDSHIHIESTMLLPYELSKLSVRHGTVAVLADPHEIANVCGTDGIKYMLAASDGIPLKVFIMLPSCVPATPFDEAGAILQSDDLLPFYKHRRVLGLGEMMNYPGVVEGVQSVLKKIKDAHNSYRVVDGHAPLLSGHALDKYISEGINSDHECTSFEEAKEKISKGQYILVREGTAAKNLKSLLPCFDKPYSERCCLCTDDRNAADLLLEGHVDNVVRKAVSLGKSPITAIKMASYNAASYLGLHDMGAIAPGRKADILVLSDLKSIRIKDVYINGTKYLDNDQLVNFSEPSVPVRLNKAVHKTVHLDEIHEENFFIKPDSPRCRVIHIIPGQILTEEMIAEIDWQKNNGINLDADILKLAVIERHKKTGHIGLGFINGIGLKHGAVASTVSHDNHNLIVVGTNERDMAVASNAIIEMGGGNVFASGGEVIGKFPLPVAGLMSESSAEDVAAMNKQLKILLYDAGVPENVAPLMNMAFVSLTVIPSLKMSTHGLVDVNSQKLVSLYI